MITFDYTNVLEHSSAVPESRVSVLQLQAPRSVRSTPWTAAHREGKLAFANLPLAEKPVKDVLAFAREHAFKNIIILGIGGSALGPAALEAALARPKRLEESSLFSTISIRTSSPDPSKRWIRQTRSST